MNKIRGAVISRWLTLAALAALLVPFGPTPTLAQSPPQMRQSIDFTLTNTSSTEERRVGLMDTTGFQSYELQVLSTVPASSGDFGTFVAIFYESNPDTGSPIGAVRVPFKFEIDAGFAAEGPVRGEFMELKYLSPASNLSSIKANVDLVNRPVESDKARDEGGIPLDRVFSSIAAGATTAYEYATLVSGQAILVVAAPSRKGTFRVQLGGADFEDIPVAAGVTLRVPYTLPLRSMSVRVTNTDLAAGSYSSRLIAASH